MSSSSSDSHHSHHSHRRHSRSRTKRRNMWINIISCSVSFILIIVLAMQSDMLRSKRKGDDNSLQMTNSTLVIETAIYSDEVVLASDAIINYMQSVQPSDVKSVYDSFDGWKHKLNVGQPWDFTYRVKGLPAGIEVKSAELELSENKKYENSRLYTLNLQEDKFSVYNLKPNTQYYYTLRLGLSDDTVAGTIGEFKTADSPRILNIEGAVNVRDIGGMKTLSGKKIKYGLLYRGSELDGKVEKEYCLTEKGKKQMLEDLKIKFDMDLRSTDLKGDAEYVLGKGVKQVRYGASDYADFLDPQNNDTARKIFADLSKKENYPIYMHCTYGRDRTGTVAYLLEALLGVSDEDLYRDYALSAFTDSYVEIDVFERFIDKINQMEGKSTQQKVENWLLSIGVTKTQIKNIKEILLEG